MEIQFRRYPCNGNDPFLPIILHLLARLRLKPGGHRLAAIRLFADPLYIPMHTRQGTAKSLDSQFVEYSGADEAFLNHPGYLFPKHIHLARKKSLLHFRRRFPSQIFPHGVFGYPNLPRNFLDRLPLQSHLLNFVPLIHTDHPSFDLLFQRSS